MVIPPVPLFSPFGGGYVIYIFIECVLFGFLVFACAQDWAKDSGMFVCGHSGTGAGEGGVSGWNVDIGRDGCVGVCTPSHYIFFCLSYRFAPT